MSPFVGGNRVDVGGVSVSTDHYIGGERVAPLSLAEPYVQRLGDLTKVPPGMSCTPANSSPTPPIQSHLFTIFSSTLTPSQIVDIENVVISWHATGTNPIIRVDGYASTDGADELNWQLSCDRASVVARELEAPSSGAPGIPSSNIEVFAQGETFEFSPALEPNRRATITTTSVSYTHLRAHETVLDLVCRLLLEKKKSNNKQYSMTLQTHQ